MEFYFSLFYLSYRVRHNLNFKKCLLGIHYVLNVVTGAGMEHKEIFIRNLARKKKVNLNYLCTFLLPSKQ